jgi:hypothetical protein
MSKLTRREKAMVVSGCGYTLNMGCAIIGIIETGISAINGKTKAMYYYAFVSAYNMLIASHHKTRYHALQSTADCNLAKWSDPRLKESNMNYND